MKNTKPTLIALITLFLGWFLVGIGYGNTLTYPINTILYVVGVVLFFTGVLTLIYLLLK
ncbi:MAG: hypothetical protein ABJF11_04215 [Reichenbachiella sp.]|uniref:hypothetical protein n=1 Tax=Reichenbachiella sp. TaxID=2184521 RepID=UPI003264918F